MANRQWVETSGDSVTDYPPPRLRARRAVADALQLLIPAYIALFRTVGGFLLLYLSWAWLGFVGTLLMAPLIQLYVGLYTTVFLIGVREAVVGTFKPVIQTHWSKCGAYESAIASFIAEFLDTPFIAPLQSELGIQKGA